MMGFFWFWDFVLILWEKRMNHRPEGQAHRAGSTEKKERKERMDSRFRGNDPACCGTRHPRRWRDKTSEKMFNYKEWIDVDVYVNIWNEQSKDVSWCLVCNLVCFVYEKIGVDG